MISATALRSQLCSFGSDTEAGRYSDSGPMAKRWASAMVRRCHKWYMGGTCSESGHEEACRLALQYGRSPSDT